MCTARGSSYPFAGWSKMVLSLPTRPDDLDDEVLMDVPTLVRSGSKQSFPLTGRVEKAEVTLSSAKWLNKSIGCQQ